tara:strand:- start:5382 stop:7211 length:1830 start_codon:yes stop_codon:yes gene_type:complete
VLDNIITSIQKKIKACLLIGFFLMYSQVTFSQDQQELDSLKLELKKGNFTKTQELEKLTKIAEYDSDPNEILLYSKKVIELAEELNIPLSIYHGYLQKGNGYRFKSDLTKALESYFKAAKIAEDNGFFNKQATIKISIADAYSIMGDSKNAVNYYRNSIELLKKEKEIDSINLASAQLNLGDEYYNQKKLDSALYFFKQSGKLFKELEYEEGVAYNLGNVGLVYAEKEEFIKAEKNLNEAIRVLTKLEDYYPISVYLNAMSDVYFDKNEIKKAFEYANKSLALAKKYGLKEQISDGYLKLSDLLEKGKDYKKSFSLYKRHIQYRDSVRNVLDVQEMADIKTKFEVAKKQSEVDLLNEQKRTQRIIAIAISITLLLIGMFAFSLFKKNKIIAHEKERSDGLLKNILPEETAKELKEKGFVKAKKFDSVSVLFTDFKGFTKYSEKLTPEEIVKSMNFYFSKFDTIVEKYGLEKIKTIGDAYMCAGGLPFPTKDHTYKITLAALEIAEFVKETMEINSSEKANFDIRIGINTGPVVAGVVGTIKFAYDIWGDTVNVASRMESSGEIGKVNISEETYNFLKTYKEFQFEPRGAIEAKGKGKINMYFVNKNTNN